MPLISLPASNPCGSMQPPFFRALHALAVDDAGGGAGLTFGLLAAFDVERVVDLLQRAVVAPQTKVFVHRAARRQILRDVAPLAPGAQDIHDAVHHIAHIDAPFAAAALGWWNQRLDMRPLRVGQIARIAQLVAVVAGPVLDRPHRRPPRIRNRRPLEITNK